MSLACAPKNRADSSNFSKALARFQKEDPTFRAHTDQESGQMIISGMGELHLEIYVERMKREYKTECSVGHPQVGLHSPLPFSNLGYRFPWSSPQHADYQTRLL